MPDPIPVVVLARLAVASNQQGVGLGTSLLQDAIVRSVAAATSVGMRAMLVHALTERRDGSIRGSASSKRRPAAWPTSRRSPI